MPSQTPAILRDLYSALDYAYTYKRKPIGHSLQQKRAEPRLSEGKIMTVSTLARSSVTTITDELRAEAAEVVAQVGDDTFSGVTITTETGKSIQVPDGLAKILDAMVHQMQQGGRLVLESMPELLTTSNAADVLGVSRPTLVKLITDGKLPATKHGTHRRVKWSDLSEFRRAREAERSAAIEKLLEADFGGE